MTTLPLQPTADWLKRQNPIRDPGQVYCMQHTVRGPWRGFGVVVIATGGPAGEIGKWRLTRWTPAFRSRRGALQGPPAGKHWKCMRTSFRSDFRTTSAKISSTFLTVRHRHVVTMKYLWGVDIWLAESAHKFYLGWPWQGYLKATKVKIACGFSSVRDRSKLAIGCLCSFDDIDRGKDWFGAMNRLSQQ